MTGDEGLQAGADGGVKRKLWVRAALSGLSPPGPGSGSPTSLQELSALSATARHSLCFIRESAKSGCFSSPDTLAWG